MTLDKVDELNNELNKIKDEIDIVFNKDIKTMWFEQIRSIIRIYQEININLKYIYIIYE